MKKNSKGFSFPPDEFEVPLMPYIPICPHEYRGERDPDGTARLYFWTWENGEDSIYEITPDDSLSVRNHSPTGFNWGYGGSGPHQLGLAILLHALAFQKAPDKVALSLYHRFVTDVISILPNSWRIAKDVVEEWVAESY